MAHSIPSQALGARGRAAPPAVPRTLSAAIGLGLLLVHLTLSPLLFSTATLGAFEFPKFTLLTLAALLLIPLGLCTLLRPRGAQTPRRLAAAPRTDSAPLWRQPLFLGVVLFVLSAAASTALSISPLTAVLGTHDSHAGLCTIVAYGVLFCATRGLCRTYGDARLVLGACVLGSAVASAYALCQFAGLDPIAWGDRSNVGQYLRPFGPLGNPNFLAAYLVMALPLTVYYAQRAAADRRWYACAILALVGLLSCAAIVLSVSRAAWVALGCVALILVVGALGARRWRTAAVVLGLPAGAAALLVTAALLGGEDGLLGAVRLRLEHLTDALSRWHIWDAALATFRDHPLFGTGPDTFQLAFGLKRTAAYWQIEWNATPTRAHNEFIHVLATQGLVGAVALLVALLGLAWAGWRAWRRAPAEARPLVLALLAGTAAFAVESAVGYTVVACGALFVTFAGMLSRFGEAGTEVEADGRAPGRRWFAIALPAACLLAALGFGFNFVGEGIAVTLVTGAGLAVVLGGAGWVVFREAGPNPWTVLHSTGPAVRADSPVAIWRPLARGAVWVGAAGAVAVGVVCPLQANVLCRTGVRLFVERPRDGVSALAEAALLDPTKELYWVKLGGAAQSLAQHTGHPGERRELWVMAQVALMRASILSPLNPYHHDNLGLVLGRMAREQLATITSAYAEFDRAIELDRHNVNFYADAAHVALGVEDVERARKYATRGAEVFPRFAPTHAILGYVALKEHRGVDAVNLLCRAVHGEWFDQPQGRIMALANLAGAYLDLGMYEESLNAGRQAVAQAPQLTDCRCNLARCLEALGRFNEAAVEYRQILEQVPGHGLAAAGLRRTGSTAAWSAGPRH